MLPENGIQGFPDYRNSIHRKYFYSDFQTTGNNFGGKLLFRDFQISGIFSPVILSTGFLIYREIFQRKSVHYREFVRMDFGKREYFFRKIVCQSKNPFNVIYKNQKLFEETSYEPR